MNRNAWCALNTDYYRVQMTSIKIILYTKNRELGGSDSSPVTMIV